MFRCLLVKPVCFGFVALEPLSKIVWTFTQNRHGPINKGHARPSENLNNARPSLTECCVSKQFRSIALCNGWIANPVSLFDRHNYFVGQYSSRKCLSGASLVTFTIKMFFLYTTFGMF